MAGIEAHGRVEGGAACSGAAAPCVSRRLAVAAGSAALLPLLLPGCSGGGPGDSGESAESAEPEGAAEGRRMQLGFLMDVAKCITCGSCVAACADKAAQIEGAAARRELIVYRLHDGESATVSVSCMHCEQPACVEVCPAGALAKRADGIVVVDRALDIGCGYCGVACPFGVPRYTGRGMDKCDCCLESGVEPGEAPFCVRACRTGALAFGPIDELQRAAGDAARRLEAPTKPAYLLVRSDA